MSWCRARHTAQPQASPAVEDLPPLGGVTLECVHPLRQFGVGSCEVGDLVWREQALSTCPLAAPDPVRAAAAPALRFSVGITSSSCLGLIGLLG